MEKMQNKILKKTYLKMYPLFQLGNFSHICHHHCHRLTTKI